VSNTELDTERDRNMKELVEYLATYIGQEEDSYDPGTDQDHEKWIAEGIEAFESIHDVKVCVMSEVWRYSDGKG